MLDDRLKQLSKHIIGISAIKKSVNKWNSNHVYQYHEAQMESDINKCRNDLQLVMGRHFNQIQLLPGRLWTNPENLMFYVYIDQCIREKYNTEESLTKFAFYSGRTLANVVHKASTYLPLVPFFRKSNQYAVISLMEHISTKYTRVESSIFVNARYNKAQSHIDACLVHQQSVVVPTVDSKNQPKKYKIEQNEHTIQDLVDKFNRTQTVMQGEPPFSNGDAVTTLVEQNEMKRHTSFSEEHIANATKVHKELIIGSTDSSNLVPFAKPETEIDSKHICKPEEVIETVKDVPPVRRNAFEMHISRLIDNQSLDKYKVLTFDHNLAKILNEHMPKLMDKQLLFKHLVTHRGVVESYDSTSLKYDTIHEFLIQCLRGGIPVRSLAKFLSVSEKHISKYILNHRGISADFIRRPDKDQYISYIELNVIHAYIKDLNTLHHLETYDAIYIATRMFNLPAKWLIHSLVNEKLITSSVYTSEFLAVALTSKMYARTKILNAATTYITPPIVNLTIEPIRGPLLNIEYDKPRDSAWIGTVYSDNIPPDLIQYLMNHLVENQDPMVAKRIVEQYIISEPTNKVPDPDVAMVPTPSSTPTIVPDKIIDITDPDQSLRWKKNVVTEFIRWRCIASEGTKVSFEHMYIAFEMYCKSKSLMPISIADFNKTMIAIDVRKAADEFNGYHWVDLRFYEENLIRSELDTQFEQLCTTIHTVFPNINIKQSIKLVQVMMSITDETVIDSIDMGLIGKVLTFNGLSETKLKELKSIISTS